MDENIDIEAIERASFATYACLRLVLLNYQLYSAGCPIKLYAEMEHEIDNFRYLDFLELLNNEHLVELEELLPFISNINSNS
jgi:hypothetical protein